MSPYQHGEVFVTDDGAETDLDLGHYERFTRARLTRDHNWTAGRIYEQIIAKERRGDYLGKTVQVVPHVTNEIKAAMRKVATPPGAAQGETLDVIIIEVGGTVGDIESLPFLEAIRQMRLELGRESTLFIHVTLVPFIETAGELKTKPTQHSVKELREIGIQPDILLCRTERSLTHEVKAKIAMFCNVAEDAVINARDVDSIYEVPLALAEEKLDEQIVRRLELETPPADLARWRELSGRSRNPNDTVRIGVVGKYVLLQDSYKSLGEALVHGGLAHNLRTEIAWIESEGLEQADDWQRQLDGLDGILVPGGFGRRGIPGMLLAIRHARENKIPFFGICLGMQCAVLEFARNVCGLADADSTEFNPATPHRVIYKLRELLGVEELGGTMRLGAWTCHMQPDSHTHKAYGAQEISERHRHRYEFNREYEETLVAHGLRITGATPDGTYVEIVELPPQATDNLPSHPWFLGCQFHPEFKSNPFTSHPLFRDFVAASYRNRLARTTAREKEEFTATKKPA
jgi:CTP synthase